MTTTQAGETARRITEDINRVSTLATVARAAGLKRTTLADHLANPQRLTISEVYAIAEVLRADPADYLTTTRTAA